MKKPDFERSMTRLEQIVQSLEGGELSLEDSMKLYEEGMKLSAVCYKILNEAEQKIHDISEFENEEE